MLGKATKYTMVIYYYSICTDCSPSAASKNVLNNKEKGATILAPEMTTLNPCTDDAFHQTSDTKYT